MKKVLVSLLLILLFVAVPVVKADDTEYSEGGNVGTYAKVVCGDSEIPYFFPKLTRNIIVVLQVAAPVIIILMGSLDVLKAVAAQKSDDIKKGFQTFIKRLLIGVMVFLTIALVELAIGLVAPKDDNENMWNCVDCFVNGDCASIKK